MSEVQEAKSEPERQAFVMQRMHQVLTLLQEGLQEPFPLYTLEVITKLMKDIPKLEAAPDIGIIESIPNRGKVYYGEDIQMITLMKKRCLELKEKIQSPVQITDKLAEWLEQYADIVIRTQYDQKWCEQQIIACIRVFRDKHLHDLDGEAKPEPQKDDQKSSDVTITVTFDAICGCAYVYKRTKNQALKALIFSNLLAMADICIGQMESFIECLKKSPEVQQTLESKQEQSPPSDKALTEPASEIKESELQSSDQIPVAPAEQEETH